MSTIAAIALATLAAHLVVAAWGDVRRRRIPNALIASGLICALGLHAAAFGTQAVGLAGARPWAPALGMLAGAIALGPLYALRACAAGDIKLMAMVGAFVGAPLALASAFLTVLAGGLVAALFMLRPGVARRTVHNLAMMARAGDAKDPPPMQRTAARLPYGVAIALGTTSALALRALS